MKSQLKSMHKKITLMESELLLESKSSTLASKIKTDISKMSKQESMIREKFGDKYDKAVKLATQEAQTQIYKIKDSVKKLADNKNENIFEKLSKYIFLGVESVIDSVYKLFQERSIKQETSKTFSSISLFGAVLITNTVFASAIVTGLKISNDHMSELKAIMIAAVFIAPLTEEYAKRAASNISPDIGMEYTKLFATIEAGMYIMKIAPILGFGQAFLIRVPAFLMHIFTTYFQQTLTAYSENLRYISFMLAIFIHAAFNAAGLYVQLKGNL